MKSSLSCEKKILKAALSHYEFFVRYGDMSLHLKDIERVRAYLPVLRSRIKSGG